jgi:hypothetical protein
VVIYYCCYCCLLDIRIFGLYSSIFIIHCHILKLFVLLYNSMLHTIITFFIISKPGESLPWEANTARQTQPHDDPEPTQQSSKNYFTPAKFYCVETICAPCGLKNKKIEKKRKGKKGSPAFIYGSRLLAH